MSRNPMSESPVSQSSVSRHPADRPSFKNGSVSSVLILLVFLLLNVVFWFSVRDMRHEWLNVPPAPALPVALSAFLGDKQLSYRTTGLMIQNMGDTGGRSTALGAYDYDALSGWFFLLDALDPQSSFAPFLASFYFGSVNDPDKLRPLIGYLEVVGQRPGKERWRWLGQAVYLARFKLQDMELALRLAGILATLEDQDRPVWTRQMPAFIQNAKGNKEEARAILLEILKTSADKVHPNEVYFMRDYICNRLMEKEEAAALELCQNIP